MKNKKLTILIVDDHAVLRAGLKLLLSSQPDFEVVGEGSSGLEVFDLVEELQPDIILLDLSMPGIKGLDVLPTIHNRYPKLKVLVLTMHEDPQYLKQALKAGAAGYILKKAADTELLSAIRIVAKGEIYVHPSLTHTLLKGIIPAPVSSDEEDLWDSLSDREREVLRLVALGYTSAEIAEKLQLSPKTVDTYRARGMEKLGLKSRAVLVRFALRRGLLTQD